MSYLKSVYGLVATDNGVNVENIDGKVIHTLEGKALDPNAFSTIKEAFSALKDKLKPGYEVLPAEVFAHIKDVGPVVVYSEAVENLAEVASESGAAPVQILTSGGVDRQSVTKADFMRTLSRTGIKGVSHDTGVFEASGEGYLLFAENDETTTFLKVHSIDGQKPELADLRQLVKDLEIQKAEVTASVRRGGPKGISF